MHRLIVLLPALLLGLVGCQTAETRARHHHELFTSLDAGTQARLLSGEAMVGDTPAMVEIAYGSPQIDKAITTASGRERRTWVYTKKHYTKEESQISHSSGRSGAVIEDVYRVLNVLEREITFLDGRVVHVRDPQREAQALAAIGPLD
ncbi:hypothetical protein [Actomonas aquatica]|uniref:Lipoprotein SmpA/OmlA domain-containing protein n=1 Tax=Actomonas aquatica TaxID=2866162 RepID=A0ABZ1CDH6_9BACT|nr:hypothetical protein [Opitutus sp. WL0086]WRQ89614.1 hypothetical protein K1X11_009350 [Opitutus sp. WL0086]